LPPTDPLNPTLNMPLESSDILIASTPISESWFFASILALFAILVYTIIISSDWISLSIRFFFKVKERNSLFATPDTNSRQVKTLPAFFSLAVISLFTCEAIHSPGTALRFINFGKLLLLFGCFYLAKRLLMEITAYVFMEKSKSKIARESYISIINYLGLFLFPLMVLHVYGPAIIADIVLSAGIIVLLAAVLMFIIKLFQIFYTTKLVLFYILLYLCTLEILPLFYLCKAVERIV
jgi:hypothetical protein